MGAWPSAPLSCPYVTGTDFTLIPKLYPGEAADRGVCSLVSDTNLSFLSRLKTQGQGP